MSSELDLQNWFGDIDIYLFDQLLKGRLFPGMRLLDAGCGGGRNLNYFLKSGFDVSGVDQSPEAIARVRALAASLAPNLASDNFRVEPVELMSFADSHFDVVVSSAVLHFARHEEHWRKMVREMWRVLKPGGIFFARLASSIGIESEIEHLEERHYRLPDGSTRFLVDEQMLMATTEALGGEWLEPFKTVVVQHQRSMSNWVVRKR
ncbi:MAG TPA: class I SAM-dependent methyltransferase [Pyrinomonadaceae bacterium]|nr:class I SAM-dependent methyltransferase [Pyrinomonadaceae bacterium]